MGFFDRFTSKKPAAPAPTTNGTAAAPAADAPELAPVLTPAANVKARLTHARERLEAKDLPGALAVYEELLATSGDRPDVLVTISGDLGTHGHITHIIELVAPRYDADRHGPATGLNLLQAYLAVRNPDAAQHVLDILYALNRPELEERLHGFSNAIAELLGAPDSPSLPAGAASNAAKVGLITISKPIWFYGLEPLGDQVLPPKDGRLRRIAFAQLSLPGRAPKSEEEARQPEDELGRLSRALPLWLAETFYFSPLYAPIAALGVVTPPEGKNHLMTFATEWTTENLRQLVESNEGGVDYVFTGALRAVAGDYEAVLRVWEVKTFRERKSFQIRWTPGNADAALGQLHGQIRAYMEWSPASAAFAYTLPNQPRSWLETLGASCGLFLAEKSVLPAEQLPPVAADVKAAGERAATNEAAALAYLTLRARAAKLGTPLPEKPALARSPLVLQAQQLLG